MKKFLQIFVLLLSVLIVYSTSAQTPVKRVLFEQHTGAWCGWCVDGSYKLEQLIEANPGRVIPVKWHNGDAMVIPLQADVAKAMGLTGYPAGCIDRKQFNGTYFPNRISGSDASVNAWLPLVAQQLAQAPKVDVQMVYSINPQTREFKATITATMLETVNNELGFNLYIIEDSLTGSGTGWDQSNYLAGRAGYQFSPYYTLPGTITGYYHREVVRDALGGALSLQGSFTNPAISGKVYKQYFEYKLSQDWNLNKLHFVASVQGSTPAFREVLNANYGVVGTPEAPDMEIATTDEPAGVVNSGVAYVNTFELTNKTNVEKTFAINLTKSTRTPSEWTADVVVKTGGGIIKKNEITQSVEATVPAGGSVDFDLSLTPSSVIGVGDAFVEIETVGESNGMKRTAKLSVYSKEIDHFYVNNSTQATYSINNYLPTSDKYFKFEADEFTSIGSKFGSGVNTLVWDIGATDAFNADQMNTIKTVMGYGSNVFLLGNLTTTSLNSIQSLSYFNLQYNNLSREGYGSAPYRVWLSGIADDPISGNLGTSFEGNLINYLLHMFKIANTQKAFPILKFRDDQTAYNSSGQSIGTVLSNDALLGARVLTNYDGRAVILSITPNVIVDPNKRKELLDNIFVWLKGESDVNDNVVSNGSLSISANPNPIEDLTSINYAVANSQNVRISLFNELGQEVSMIFEGNVSAGSHSTTYSAKSLANGTYFMVMKSGTDVVSIPVVIVK